LRSVALVGNGLSIAYNADLEIPNLTRDLLSRFSVAGGDLAAIASDVDPESSSGFEDLLGPFDSAARVLEALPGITSPEFAQRLQIIGNAASAARHLYREGTSEVLGLIADASHGRFEEHVHVERFCQALADLGPASDLTVATLNYDGLLHSGFLRSYIDFEGTTQVLPISDMADGRSRDRSCPDFAGGDSLESGRLRGSPDFMKDRSWVLNLHGSLGWLRRDGGEYRKFRIEDLRASRYWEKLRDGETEWEPVVVLTNQKGDMPRRYPFSVAYEAFRTQLVLADRWLIVGYGFGDDPVNTTLRQAVADRSRAGAAPPRVLVVGFGDEGRVLREARQVLRIDRESIRASAIGLPAALESGKWNEWAQTLV